jgi:tungstate transport system substrate-binding protein
MRRVMRKTTTVIFLLSLLMSLAISSGAQGAESKEKIVVLSTTTSTQDSGLLDVLLPRFEKETGYSVKTIAVGTGQALFLAAKGEADVTLVHAPGLEKKYVAEGKLLNRRLVMYNDFVIVGPKEDVAKIKFARTALAAFKLIEQAKASFVSRGDNSGTHELEKSLWKQAGVEPKGAWYIESGQGMGPTLVIANERNAYTLTDRGTYLAFRKRVPLPILLERDKLLLNIYSVIEVNSANGPRVNATGGKAFADFLVSSRSQAVIGSFGIKTFGQPLFMPSAGRPEEEIGG